MANFERIANTALQGAAEAAKAEVIAQMTPHVQRARNGVAEFLGVQSDDEDDDDEDDGDDAAAVDRCDLTYIFGMDGSTEPDESLSLAVSVWRVACMAEGKELTHWVAVHKLGYAACGPADCLEDELIAKSEAAGVNPDHWEVHTRAHDILALEYDVGDVADFAAEACEDDDEFDEQVAIHNGFNWEHDSAAIVTMTIPGVSAGWQLGHALTLATDRGTLDWSNKAPLPAAVGIGEDTYVIHGANVRTTPAGICVDGGKPQAYADWRQSMVAKFGANHFELDGIDAPAFPMGRARRFDYKSNKDQADPARHDEYTHEHGEESGELPSVFAIGPQTIAVCGGNMHIAPEGVRD